MAIFEEVIVYSLNWNNMLLNPIPLYRKHIEYIIYYLILGKDSFHLMLIFIKQTIPIHISFYSNYLHIFLRTFNQKTNNKQIIIFIFFKFYFYILNLIFHFIWGLWERYGSEKWKEVFNIYIRDEIGMLGTMVLRKSRDKRISRYKNIKHSTILKRS